MEAPFTETLMRTIAQELGKPYSAMQEFMKVLLDNWVDSREALIMLDETLLSQLNFPLLVQKKLLEKIEFYKTQPATSGRVDTN